jgi:hypothetical protein
LHPRLPAEINPGSKQNLPRAPWPLSAEYRCFAVGDDAKWPIDTPRRKVAAAALISVPCRINPS